VAPEKTCLTTAVPFRPPSTAPIMNVVRITPCQSGVIGKLMMAWATIDGKRDRVQANTTPNPIAITNKLAIMAMLYGLGIKYWACAKVNRQAVGLRTRLPIPPVDRDDEQEPPGLLQHQQHGQLARRSDQSGIRHVRSKGVQRIDELESEHSDELIHHEPAGDVYAEYLEQRGGASACIHRGQSISAARLRRPVTDNCFIYSRLTIGASAAKARTSLP
jgi:hypothetical protein